MRPTRPSSALIGLLAIGGVAAGCGTATQSRSAAARPQPPLAARQDPARVAFLTPPSGASIGSTVRARVKVSGHGRVRFILDGGSPRVAAGSAITYRHLAPGRHRLAAQLLSPTSDHPAATATTRFDVRRPVVAHAPSAAHPTQDPGPTSTPTPPAAPATPSPSSPTTSTPNAPPPPPATQPSAPTVHPPAPGEIPQGGGGDGDGDGDNSGGSSDDDGNV